MGLSTMHGELESEFRYWTDAGLTAVFWLRDDDAVSVTPALLRLENLARRYEIGVGLAVVPGRLQPDLADHLKADKSPFFAMCHGWVHENHGTPTQPSEFCAARPPEAMAADLNHARAAMTSKLGVAAPYFVPPFGQIAPSAAAELPALGFAGLSNQSSRALNQFVRLNSKHRWLPKSPMPRPVWPATLDAHVDPIDWWKQTARDQAATHERLVGELRVRRKGYKAVNAPIGLLGHHLVHDEAIWDSLERLIALLRAQSCAQFPPIRDLAAKYAFTSNRSLAVETPRPEARHRAAQP